MTDDVTDDSEGGGVTYALWFGLDEDGGRAPRGGREAPLDPYTIQHVQQYLSIRTFVRNMQRAGGMIRHADTTTESREKTRDGGGGMERGTARTTATY